MPPTTEEAQRYYINGLELYLVAAVAAKPVLDGWTSDQIVAVEDNARLFASFLFNNAHPAFMAVILPTPIKLTYGLSI